jgi:two-component system, cell cycle sensor histidine kinase and response regulator CckA
MVQIEEAICARAAKDTGIGPAKQPIHIIVVDDEEGIREVVRALLQAAGYTVTVAEGGPIALKLAQDFPGAIDLLITDIRMPEMDGTELARRVQALRPETKVLFMSAFAGDLFASGQIKPGQNFLAKPFSGETLVEKLREVL